MTSSSKKSKGNYIPPGHYTPETLPPLSEEAQRIIKIVQADIKADKEKKGSSQ